MCPGTWVTLPRDLGVAGCSRVRMPWHTTDPLNERLKFVAAHQRGAVSMSQLCEKFGISRKTGYKILGRYRDCGPAGFRDRSRAPRTHPNRTSPEMEGAILRVRKTYPTWGSKKILAVLARSIADGELVPGCTRRQPPDLPSP